VGCAAAYDQRVAQVARAVVKVLREAEVSFAVMGEQEKCTGEIARRLGEEGRFQMLALENIEALQSAGTRKIVTHCPHCYNVLKHEYPELGGAFEVVHHTELIYGLVRQGRLPFDLPATAIRVTYHDPCNLSRVNEIAEEPRQLLRSVGSVDLVEMERTRDRTFCCGAGGANAWYNVPERERMSHIRAREAHSTGAEVIATACPFCLNMLEDAARSSIGMAVRDVAEIVADGLESSPWSPPP